MPEKARKLIRFFNQPFQYIHRRWLVVVISSAWVFLVAIVLRPLGISLSDHEHAIVFIFTVVTIIVVSFVMYGLPFIFKNFYHPDNWTVGKYLTIPLSIVIIIAPICAFLVYFLSVKENKVMDVHPFYRLFVWYARASFVAAVPTFLFFLVGRNQRNDIVLSDKKNEIINNNEDDKDIISLSGSTKDSLTIPADNILYAEVLRNYVSIYYKEENIVKQKSLRTTLQQITEVLEPYPQFVRCHRAFIVNLTNIADVRGNSHGYQLTLNNIDVKVPVSKSYTKAIKEKLDI